MDPAFECSQRRETQSCVAAMHGLVCMLLLLCSAKESHTDVYPSFPMLGLFVIEFLTAYPFQRITMISFYNSFAFQSISLKNGPGHQDLSQGYELTFFWSPFLVVGYLVQPDTGRQGLVLPQLC